MSIGLLAALLITALLRWPQADDAASDRIATLANDSAGRSAEPAGLARIIAEPGAAQGRLPQPVEVEARIIDPPSASPIEPAQVTHRAPQIDPRPRPRMSPASSSRGTTTAQDPDVGLLQALIAQLPAVPQSVETPDRTGASTVPAESGTCPAANTEAGIACRQARCADRWGIDPACPIPTDLQVVPR